MTIFLSYLIFGFEIAASSDTVTQLLAQGSYKDSESTHKHHVLRNLMANLAENSSAFALLGCYPSLQPA